jgi:Uma2 family endonuclease
MMSTVPQRRLTEQEYLAKERLAAFRSEFYRGEMFAMAGATREHNVITGNVFFRLRSQLDAGPCEVYSTDMRVRITPTGLYTYPDVVVACGGPRFADDEQDVLLNPTVLVEVLSPSTASYDRGDKRVHYLQLDTLRELLLVEQDFPAVEHHIRQPNGDWIERQIEDPQTRIELPSIGCVLTFAEIYARITFPPDARRPLRPTGID